MSIGRRKREKLLGMIRKHDDPILHTPCAMGDDAGRAERIQTMKAILAATDNGVGIAAPQCGFNDRVIVVHEHYEPWPDYPHAMINPVWMPQISKRYTKSEGCLSYPGVLAGVERWDEIRVSWTSEIGTYCDAIFRDFPARVIQHECDHLDGICLVGDEWRRLQS